MGTKTYIVKSSVSHDQKDYTEGKTIDLDDDAAAPLLAGGAIEASEKAPAAKNPEAPEDEAERLAAIKEAIGKLDKENKNLWIKDGRPDANSLAEITGWPVKAAERDQAWGELNNK